MMRAAYFDPGRASERRPLVLFQATVLLAASCDTGGLVTAY